MRLLSVIILLTTATGLAAGPAPVAASCSALFGAIDAAREPHAFASLLRKPVAGYKSSVRATLMGLSNCAVYIYPDDVELDDALECEQAGSLGRMGDAAKLRSMQAQTRECLGVVGTPSPENRDYDLGMLIYQVSGTPRVAIKVYHSSAQFNHAAPRRPVIAVLRLD